jgi:peroxiredoxin
MKLSAGDVAPLFIACDTEKQKITLESFRGKKVLLLFFPAAFTSTCTKELCNTRDDISYYNNMQCEVIAMSTDALFALKKYKEEQKLNFTLLSDFNKEISLAYGAQYAEWFNLMKGVAKRSAFVIDKHGIIQYAEVLENASDIPDFDAIKKIIEAV